MNLFELCGINTSKFEKAVTKKKVKKAKRKKKVIMQTLSLFDFLNKPATSSEEITENNTSKTDNNEAAAPEETKSNSAFTNLLGEVESFIKPAKKKITEVLDYFLRRDPSSKTKSERYADNIAAIKTIHSIGDKLATNNQQKSLAKYVGWGGLAERFKENSLSDKELHSLLSEEEYQTAKISTLTSFYTPIMVCKFMYKVLDRLGFKNGRILEPSAGTGRFLGCMPEDMYFDSKVCAIEPDNISYKICKNLYQSADVLNKKFQDTDFPDGSFDLIISNIPFGDLNIFDKNDKEISNMKLLIHDYFFVKAYKKLREGGLLAFVTSTGTLDKKDSKLREYLFTRMTFLGAVRLPVGTFTDTDACVDVIFMQKGYKGNYTSNFYSLSKDSDGFVINQFFAQHPKMMLGKLEKVSSQFGEKLVLSNDNPVNQAMLDKMIKYFPQEVYENPLTDEYMFDESELINAPEDLKESEYTLVKEDIYQKQGSYLIPVNYKGVRKQTIVDFINVKDCIKSLIQMQLNNCSDDELHEKQATLNSLYDEFIANYGNVSSRKNKKILSDDPMYFLVCSAEVFDSNTETYSKADIFSKRTIGMTSSDQKIENVEDALLKSMGQSGILDMSAISSLLDRPESSVTKEMESKGLIFLNPATNQYEEASMYLSGYVKEKLKVAEEAAKTNSAFQRNVDALKVNQPKYETDVYFQISTPWVPLDVKRKYIVDTLDLDDKEFVLTYDSNAGYIIKYHSYISQSLDQNIWGTRRRPSISILNALLNQKDIKVTDTKYDSAKERYVEVPNPAETQLAMSKGEKWKLAFNEYIVNHATVHKRLLDIYNEKFIDYKERVYPIILSNESIRKNPQIILREQQLRAASRIILSNNNCLLCHSVGAGKTYTMVTAAMELKRISKYKSAIDGTTEVVKSLFVIPNSLCESGQFATEFLALYPQANILATTSKDFSKENRRRIIAKMVTCDWDAIIIPHSVLTLIPIKPETESRLLLQDLEELEHTIEFYKTSDESLSVKDLEKMRQNYEERIKYLNSVHHDEGMLYWEDLGITNVFCDEAHQFKNLAFSHNLQVSGVTSVLTKKTQDLYNKIRIHREKYGEKGIIFATATPISNSMCEMFTMMRYLNYGILQHYNVESFDAWAATFGIVNTDIEVDPTGTGFRLYKRFSQFCNIPELIGMFRTFTDVVNIKDIKGIKIPDHVTGKPIIERIEPTNEMRSYINNLVKRAGKIANKQVDRTEDNMLMVTNDGRALSVSPKLKGISGESPKADKLVENIVKIYKKYPGETQLVFCDLGTPTGNKAYDVYNDIKERLVKAGIEDEQIAFIQSANTAERRKKLIRDFNDANVRILLGSSTTCGTGTNFQKHIVALHHFDCPWKPAEIEQRSGRCFRFGNINQSAYEYRYVLIGSFDAYSWQTLEVKARYIDQILSAATTTRTAEDISVQQLSYAETKACACGDPRIMNLCKIKQQIQKYELEQKAFLNQRLRDMNDIECSKNFVKRATEEISMIKSDIETLNSNKSMEKFVTIGDKSFSKEELGENLYKAIADLMTKDMTGSWGSIYGLQISYEKQVLYDDVKRVINIGNNYTFALNWNSYPKTLTEKILNYEGFITDYLEDLTKRKDDSIKNYKALESAVNKPFEHLEDLKVLKQKKADLENELNINKEKIA